VIAHDKIRPLLQRLKTYTVDWKYSFVPTEDVEYEPGIDREEVEIEAANVVSSEIRDGRWACDVRRHVIALDIDYPAHLIESSTPGHYHLYLEVPNGIVHDDYMFLLSLLGRFGVIEKGYAEVSIKRGHSDLRLPWVTKADQKLAATNFEPEASGKHRARVANATGREVW
jgi:hypothetical protein